MGYEECLATAFVEKLKSKDDGWVSSGKSVHNDRLFVSISFVQAQARPAGEGVMLTVAVQTRHRYFPDGQLVEVSIGFGKNDDAAAASVARTWMTEHYPIVLYLVEPGAHESSVFVETINLPFASQRYELISSQLLIRGQGDSSELQIEDSRFWEEVKDLVMPEIKLGVHHLRCFASRAANKPVGDVWFDAREWPEASRRALALAEALPVPAETEIMTYKQHLILKPIDIELGYREVGEAKAGEWRKVIVDGLSEEARKFAYPVLLGVYVMSKPGSVKQYEALMKSFGLDSKLVHEIACMLSSISGRWLLSKMYDSLELPDSFIWVNVDSGRGMEVRYEDYPLARACQEIVTTMASKRCAGSELMTIAMDSSEANAANNVLAKSGTKSLKKARLLPSICWTEEPFEGEDLSEIGKRFEARRASRRPKPWWKFW